MAAATDPGRRLHLTRARGRTLRAGVEGRLPLGLGVRPCREAQLQKKAWWLANATAPTWRGGARSGQNIKIASSLSAIPTVPALQRIRAGRSRSSVDPVPQPQTRRPSRTPGRHRQIGSPAGVGRWCKPVALPGRERASVRIGVRTVAFAPALPQPHHRVAATRRLNSGMRRPRKHPITSRNSAAFVA